MSHHQDWNTVTIGKKKEKKKNFFTGNTITKLDNHTGEEDKKKKTKFGKQIIKIRTQKKLKQTELARMLNVNVNSLIKWEQDKEQVPNYIKNKLLNIK